MTRMMSRWRIVAVSLGVLLPSCIAQVGDDSGVAGDDARSYAELSQSLSSCAATWVGDGYCDAACNDATNFYDGGDCCPATCKPGRTYACGSAGYDCVAPPAQHPCLFFLGSSGVVGTSFSASKPAFSVGPFPVNPPFESILTGICTSYEYARFDDTNTPWTDPELQSAFYDRALQRSSEGGSVFAYEFANLVLAGACLQQNKCGVRWSAIAPLLKGSKFYTTSYLPRTAARDSMRPDQPMLASGQLAQITLNRRLIKAAACGTSSVGQGGEAGAFLQATGLSTYGFECKARFFGICIDVQIRPSDGMESQAECAAGIDPAVVTNFPINRFDFFNSPPQSLASWYKAQ